MEKDSKVIKNISWLLFGNILQAVFSFVITSLSARYLRPSNYGLLSYSNSIVAIVSSLCTFGLTDVITKFFVSNESKSGEYIGSGLFLRLTGAISCTLVLYIFMGIVYGFNNIIVIISFLQMIGVILQSFSLFSCYFQSKLQSKFTVFIDTSSYLVVSFFKLYCLIFKKDILWFACANIVQYITSSVLFIFTYKVNGGQALKFKFKTLVTMLKESYHFIFSNMMTILLNQQDTIMLSTLLSQYDVGIYTAALNITTSWSFVLSAIYNSLTPVILKDNNEDISQRDESIKFLLFITIILGICASLGITIFSKYIILILYGKDYLSSIIPLIILSWYTLFKFINMIRSLWCLCEGIQKYEKWITGIAFSLNFILNYYFIPYSGSIGASFATLISNILIVFVIPMFFKDLRPFIKLIKDSIKPKYFVRLKEFLHL